MKTLLKICFGLSFLFAYQAGAVSLSCRISTSPINHDQNLVSLEGKSTAKVFATIEGYACSAEAGTYDDKNYFVSYLDLSAPGGQRILSPGGLRSEVSMTYFGAADLEITCTCSIAK